MPLKLSVLQTRRSPSQAAVWAKSVIAAVSSRKRGTIVSAVGNDRRYRHQSITCRARPSTEALNADPGAQEGRRFARGDNFVGAISSSIYQFSSHFAAIGDCSYPSAKL
jgi:hypothetical protein